MEKTLIYNSVTICRNDIPVLEDCCLEISKGEMVYITGPVGCGKSTLLKSMFGEAAIEKGVAMVLGKDVLKIKASELPQLRRSLGLVHQDLRLLPDRTIHENLDFVLRATDWKDETSRHKRIHELLSWVELEHTASKYPHQLSGGQKQCICICRALLNTPQMILADEPTGHLDQESGERVMALLDEARRQYECSVIVVTHNPQWPVDFPGTVYRIEDKKIYCKETE